MAIVVQGTVRISQLPEITVDLTSNEWLVIAQDINGAPLNRLKNARDFAIATRDEAVGLAVPQAVGQVLALLPTVAPLPVNASIFADELTILAGGAITPTIAAPQQHNFYVFQAGSAPGDALTFQTSLDTANTYNLSVLYAVTPSGGIFDVLVEGVPVLVGIDTYAAAPAYNMVAMTGAPFTVGSPRITVDIVTAGKVGPSAGFDSNITKVWIN